MTRKFAPIVVIFAVVVSLAALAQTGTAASSSAAAPGASPAASPAPASAAAIPAAGIKIGTINIQGAIFACNEGRRDFDALEKKFDPKRNELQNLSKEIDDLKRQLNTQGDKMNEDARANLVRNLETKQKTMQRSTEDAQNEYQQQQNEIGGRIFQKMAPVIEKFAKDNQYAVLLDVSQQWPQGQVMVFSANADVTKQVVDLYNAQSGVAAPTAPSSSSKPASGTTMPKSTTTTPHKPATTTAPATPPKQ